MDEDAHPSENLFVIFTNDNATDVSSSCSNQYSIRPNCKWSFRKGWYRIIQSSLLILDACLQIKQQSKVSYVHTNSGKKVDPVYNLSNAIRHPRAMMVKLFHTTITGGAVLCTKRPDNLVGKRYNTLDSS